MRLVVVVNPLRYMMCGPGLLRAIIPQRQELIGGWGLGEVLDAVDRLAILDVWNGKCAWCGLSLAYTDLEVDHLIARSLRGHDLAMARQAHALPPAFDVFGFENLVPSCRVCNRGKGKRALPSSPRIALLLKDARRRKPKVSKRAEAFRQQKSTEALLIQLVQVLREQPDTVDEVVGKLVQLLQGESGNVASILARRYVLDASISYGRTTRRTWLVSPPGLQGVVVVLEGPADTGGYVQNCAEAIAEQVHRQYPGYTTVLHYDQEQDKPWGGWWKVVPVVDGRGVWIDSGRPRDFPAVWETLRAARLVPDEDPWT